MSKYLFFIISILFSVAGYGQTNPVDINQPYNFKTWIKVKDSLRAARITPDSTLQLPTGCGVPSGTASLKGANRKKSAIYRDSCGKKTYVFEPSDSTWSEVGSGGSADSTTFATKYGVDTAKVNIRTQIATKLNISDTTNKWVNYIRRRPGTDTVEIFKNGSWQFAYRDSIGSGSGATNLDTVRNGTSVTITNDAGTDAVILGASRQKAGVITTGEQGLEGNKSFYGPRTNFQGYSPILNTQYNPSQVLTDSIYNNRYIGFGGIDIFPNGTYAIVYTDSHNHVGDSAFLKLALSTDQAHTWTTDTLLRISADTSVSMGGMGISPSGRLIVFYYKFTTLAQFGMFIIYSDDLGATWSSPVQISNLSHPIYNPYGGLCKIANNKLLFSWYGYTIGGAYKVYSITSSDDGATWSASTEVFSNPDIKPTETMFTHLGGGYILGLARSDSTYNYTQLVSTDNGVTWDSVGHVAFGHHGTPAWVKTYIDEYGKRIVVAYYRYSPTVDIREIRAIYGYADSLIVKGVNGWDLTTEKTLVDSVDGSGYISVVHPNDGPGGTGYFYDENSPQFRSALKFVRVPLSNGIPTIGPKGIYGLTAGRIPVVKDQNTLQDFDAFRYNDADTVLHFGGGTGRDWDDIKGAIEGGNSSIMLNNGAIGFMNNAYLGKNGGVSDYRYASNGAASIIFGTNGSIFGYTAGAGSINQAITLHERFRFTDVGEWWVNNSAGTNNYTLVTGGVGAAASYKPRYYTLADFPADANNSGTGETDLYSYTIPADIIHANLQKLAFDIGGTFSDATATPRIRLYFAGTLIYDSGVLTLTGTGEWSATVLLMRTNSAIVRTKVIFVADNSNSANNVDITEIGSIDFSATNIIKITGTATGAGGGSNDITSKLGTIYFTPQQ